MILAGKLVLIQVLTSLGLNTNSKEFEEMDPGVRDMYVYNFLFENSPNEKLSRALWDMYQKLYPNIIESEPEDPGDKS